MSVRHLEALFHPGSVAVIGASDRKGSVGSVVLRNLKLGGFKGAIWPVNRRHTLVDGGPAWPDVASLPQAPDLAVICTPAATLPELIDALGRKGTKAAIVLSAGLKQPSVGGGPSLEQAMLDAARPWLLRILGPNCIGALVPGVGLNASFAPGNALPGGLAFVTQSGALATAMLDWANTRGIGFSHFISLGDSADVDFGDVINYLASDPTTRAILLYMESVKAARKFMSAARAAARNKPVIIVKAGRAPDGARAAASHTGALAGSDTVFDAAVRRAGMLRVDTLESLFDAAETLTHAKHWHGEQLAVLTNGGGAGVLAADALSMGGGVLALLTDNTLHLLDQCLPSTWSHGNPVDIVGDAPVGRYVDSLRVLLAAPEVDGVLFIHAPTAIVPAADIALACLPLMQTAPKPVLTCWLGGAAVAAARKASAESGVASYDTPERATAAWLQLATYARNQQALQQLATDTLDDFTPDRGLVQTLLEDALREGREWLGDAQAQAVLRAYGIPTVETVQTRDVEEAVVVAAEKIGYPVALKIISPQVIHKSDVGGVALGLASGDELRAAAANMCQQLTRLLPQARVLGFTVQAMAHRPGAHELIVGIATDAVFGPVLLFGSGGTAVELNRQHAVALPPLNSPLARDLVAASGLSTLLAGYRGRPPSNEQALLATLLKVSQMACDLAWLVELDINPLLVDERGVLAVDARIKLRRVPPNEVSRLAIRPYPSALEERVELAGQQLLLRPIRPEDGQRLMAFYAGASPGDMRLRFFMARREVPHSELARYSQIDYDREMTFVAIIDHAGAAPRMVAEARAVCDPDNRVAEFAIQVATEWQSKGLGRVLLDKLTAYLRERGTMEVVGQCLPENSGMAALARQAGFEVSTGPLPEAIAMRLLLR
ncbi:MAG: bifunctional acetate--CoA ligase family protein/GNAT family N-acetyltransferase [Polaromonas sp.]|uniref:bifunctional acetate--CoA ligase family protein/GNAT family N-acetyltransferase n=1 Tax=Polaromonas sp. TaxID=1869339 RepID=UPI002734392B|nr:bifunctional acetate--CoA ligase family protein/GNAT family N-acetyltransferase [Polaromonas sp.]MDP2816887.1 bifunctional acetate--CoA ligase family protein/GNAT family N-acetyltransferase [Polaromonas sp.]